MPADEVTQDNSPLGLI